MYKRQLKKEVQKKRLSLDWANIKNWAKLVDELYKEYVRPKIVQPTFLIDHPAKLCPLAKNKEDNPILSERFQLVLAEGIELINAYSELNDPIEQERRFEEFAKEKGVEWEEAKRKDIDFLTALKYGMPPTAGWGMGIDRLTMILTNQKSIKDVILFPTMRPKNE